jgi:hypothetical protein
MMSTANRSDSVSSHLFFIRQGFAASPRTRALALNARSLTADKIDATRTMLALAAGDMAEDELAAWIQRNLKARS